MKHAGTPQVELFDTRLRDGLQQPNLDISIPNAVALLERMGEFGVHYAEIGFAGANQFVSDLTAALCNVSRHRRNSPRPFRSHPWPRR